MAALGFNRSIQIGEAVERELAELCSSYGWFTHKITAGFGSTIPSLVTPYGRVKSPDLQITRPYHPTVAIECKAKAAYNRSYIFDKHRIEYAHEWSKSLQIPLLFVLKTKPYHVANPGSWSVCSLRKLYGNHDYLDESSTDRNGRNCPTYIYSTDLFLPFQEFFLAGSISTRTEVSFFNINSDGEETSI